MQAWVELREQIGVKTGGQIVNGAGSKATKMVMQVAACVCTLSWAPPAPVVNLVATPTATQGFRVLYKRLPD